VPRGRWPQHDPPRYGHGEPAVADRHHPVEGAHRVAEGGAPAPPSARRAHGR
jgi:hypothetical protein